MVAGLFLSGVLTPKAAEPAAKAGTKTVQLAAPKVTEKAKAPKASLNAASLAAKQAAGSAKATTEPSQASGAASHKPDSGKAAVQEPEKGVADAGQAGGSAEGAETPEPEQPRVPEPAWRPAQPQQQPDEQPEAAVTEPEPEPPETEAEPEPEVTEPENEAEEEEEENLDPNRPGLLAPVLLFEGRRVADDGPGTIGNSGKVFWCDDYGGEDAAFLAAHAWAEPMLFDENYEYSVFNWYGGYDNYSVSDADTLEIIGWTIDFWKGKKAE